MTATRMVPVLAAAVVYILFLSGCDTAVTQSWPEEDDARTARAVESLDNLREAFNGGECESIYDEASEDFRRDQPQPEWLVQCEQLQTRLGRWENATVQATDVRRGNLLNATGTAVFANNGSCRLYAGWILERGQVRLSHLFLRGADGFVMEAPPLLPSRPLLRMDPPPKRPATASD